MASPPETVDADNWPPDYTAVYLWRQEMLMLAMRDKTIVYGAKEYYREEPVAFINHWVDTYDPRNAGRGIPASMPFVLFPRQAEMVDMLMAVLDGEENALVEKSRDMGATWLCAAFSVWLWLFWPGAAIGWGSRKEHLVDKIGDPDSIFEKMRMIIRGLPRFLLPPGLNENEHMTYMRIINPQTGSTITGEAGDNIGRGGRKLIYFKDESAHYVRPEKIEAALSDNTRVQIDISSVNGLGNVFHRRREAGMEWNGGPAHKGKTNVFILDWRDHPAKDIEWYNARKAKAESDGLMHIFAQEVDRNYSAAVEGTIIPAEWVAAAIDADITLGLPPPSGPRFGGLDVADEGGDLNAFAVRQGYHLSYAQDWGEGDTGSTTRRAVLAGGINIEIQYDSIGVGAGVKSEANRLASINKLPHGMTFTPWSAGAGPQNADKHLDPKDRNTPLNGDFYSNLKAQAWWELRRRFEKTYRAINEGIPYPVEELISISSKIPKLRQLQKELSQATASRTSSSMKLVVDKTPEGTRSPNLADAVVMAFWPINNAAAIVGAKKLKGF